MLGSIRPLVFWPSFLVLMGAVVASYVDLDQFIASTTSLNGTLLDNFSWLFSLGSLYLLMLALVVYFSPLGKIRIGGEGAEPLLSKIKWFSVTLCTTLAVGALFWTTAEPIFHLNQPPFSLGLEPGSADAALFSMSALLAAMVAVREAHGWNE